jgi:3D-(3,5/4)-trihydroxycyclohexane-1,2-dione acylhydrolase (decyclizing)
MTAFQNPDVQIVNINVAEFDAFKMGAIPVVADAKIALQRLSTLIEAPVVSDKYVLEIAKLRSQWDAEVERLFHLGNKGRPAQSEVIGALWEASGPNGVIVSAAGSHPGDLHKLWRTRSPNGYHMEYGYSCMGYEIPGALGARMADPSREVYAVVGDATYLMLPSEIVTAVQEEIKIIIILIDNCGFASIGSLSDSLGSGGFGTARNRRSQSSGQLDAGPIAVNFVESARSLGAHVLHATTLSEFRSALADAKATDSTSVVVVDTDPAPKVPGYESWWDVAVAEVSNMDDVRQARIRYEEKRKSERFYLSRHDLKH